MATALSRWTLIPLLSALAVYAAAVLTFGLGFILLPAGLALNVVAFRRTAPPRGLIFWVGSVANAIASAFALYLLALAVAAV